MKSFLLSIVNPVIPENIILIPIKDDFVGLAIQKIDPVDFNIPVVVRGQIGRIRGLYFAQVPDFCNTTLERPQ
ncbi:MAG: hypothetical protein H6555_09460 [Lewinellaceae bacterium]|nr:hypothetical protein [Lewinellaceae bacterium]